MALTDEELREAASHRGLKLVKSRGRKPGVGDYGKFGLTDAIGKPLIGIADGGLTASAEEVAEYLRDGEVSTWAESARVTPQDIGRAKAVKPDASETLPSAIRPRPRRGGTSSKSTRRIDRSPELVGEAGARASFERVARPDPRPRQAAPDAPPPRPTLAVRQARAADAKVVESLLSTAGFDGGVSGARKAISLAAARKEPILLAERAGVIGLIAWSVIVDVVEGDIGRISIVVVNEDHRREGVARMLFGAVVEEFTKRKVRLVEGMSAIEIRNANGFLRALGLRQAGYRFLACL